MEVKISFLGGAKEVGRSSYLVDIGEKFLLDHGVKLGPIKTEYPSVVRTNLNAVILSHAHLDHSGNLPHLFDYMRSLVFMTPPTLDLSRLLWFDSIKIADREGKPPKFTKKEVDRLERFVFPTNYNRRLQLTENVAMEFFDAGHIMGAAMTKLEFKDRVLVYTGDFKAEETRLFQAADLKSVGKVDYLIMECCYGDRDHTPRKEEEKRFVEKVREIMENGGVALIPAFAIGRSQELVEILYEYKIEPVFFDGMGQKAARIMFNFPEYLKNKKYLQKALDNAFWVENRKMRKEALKQPSAIVTTAGMLTGGTVYEYLPKLYKDKNSGILLTGYQVEDTPGRILLEHKRIKLNGSDVKVSCQVERFDFSAHAGRSGLIKAVKTFQPEKIVLVHGEEEVMEVFAAYLREEEGFEVYTPKNGETVVL